MQIGIGYCALESLDGIDKTYPTLLDNVIEDTKIREFIRKSKEWYAEVIAITEAVSNAFNLRFDNYYKDIKLKYSEKYGMQVILPERFNGLNVSVSTTFVKGGVIAVVLVF